ncbi:uncharacterized protein LOC134753098 [Cydia strobilella]|uniref:uncharacterized protein LOC134753098 n=1 Tax=Cydia strobilella TaxID=1100964 RepID=UPI003005A83D
METNTSRSSRDDGIDRPIPPNIELQIPNIDSITSHEIASHSLETASEDVQSPRSPTSHSSAEIINEERPSVTTANYSVPLLLISAPPSVVIPGTHASRRCALKIQSPISSQPLKSLNSATIRQAENVPQSLFIQALSRLTNSDTLNISVLSNMMAKSQYSVFGQNVKQNNAGPRPGDLSPPDSLTSAPPSYSYVLRQMAVRRRPRLMGTFIPSPSFVPHCPPPNYNAAFDIYVDNAMPPPPRLRHLGFGPCPIVCPECGYSGMSVVVSKITMCTHLCAIVLCLFCCWVCAPLPYLMSSCKDVYHYCSSCRYFLGMYCPTNTYSS